MEKSPLILPPSCKMPPKSSRSGVEANSALRLARPYTAEDSLRQAFVMPGRVLLKRASGHSTTQGGLPRQINPDPNQPGTKDHLWYGVVAGCGIASEQNGHPLDMKQFPLPAGTYVEHTTVIPYETVDGFDVVQTTAIVRSWPPGQPPPFWPKESGA